MFCVQHKYYFLKYQKVVCALWTDPLFLVNESMEEALTFLLSSYLAPPPPLSHTEKKDHKRGEKGAMVAGGGGGEGRGRQQKNLGFPYHIINGINIYCVTCVAADLVG
jgi:hypothetical protein